MKSDHYILVGPRESRNFGVIAHLNSLPPQRLMLVRMPEEGLDEALTSLKDMLDFYLEVPELSIPPKRLSHQMTGKVGSAKKRPDLVITE